MAVNEDWSSVFLQALSNSMAQSKAESKWNQELAFRDKQFGLDTQKFEADKDYNNRLLAGQKIDRQINFAQNFREVSDFGYKPNLQPGQTAPTDPAEFYKTYLASKYGNAFDNPDTPQVDYYIPNSSFNAIEADKKAAEALKQNIAMNFMKGDLAQESINKFSPVVQAGANFAKVDDIGGLFTDTNRMWMGGQNIPSGAYYDKNALSLLRNEDQKWQENQADINSRNYGAQLDYNAKMYGFGLEEKARREARLGAYKVIDKDGKEKRITNVTPEELRAQGYDLFQRIPEEEVYNAERYGRSSNNAPYGNKPIKEMNAKEISAFVQGLKDSGIDISYVPSVQNAVLNRTDELARQGYGADNSKENIWGNFIDILSLATPLGATASLGYSLGSDIYNGEPFGKGLINPKSTANQDYQKFKYKLGGIDTYDQWLQTSQDPNIQNLWNARKIAQRKNGTGQDPHTTLGGSGW